MLLVVFENRNIRRFEVEKHLLVDTLRFFHSFHLMATYSCDNQLVYAGFLNGFSREYVHVFVSCISTHTT